MANAVPKLSYEGSSSFRIRVLLATLSGKSLSIKKIRHKDQELGIKEYEVSLMRLLELVSSGCRMQFSQSATRMQYQPGLLIGGKIDHTCNNGRSLGYYLEFLMCLAPFMRTPLHATLRGITSDNIDPSVDLIRLTSLPVLKRFLNRDEGLEIKIVKRGAGPEGGGEVLFTCPTVDKLCPVQFTSAGKIKRIRGVAWGTRVDPRVCNRMVDAARVLLNKCLTDVYLSIDHRRGEAAGKCPGYGLTLVAETTEGVMMGAELCSPPQGSEESVCVPEDLAESVVNLLLDDIRIGGCVNTTSQGLACLLMTLGDRNVSKLEMGPLTDYTIDMLRHIKDVFNVTFKLESVQNTSELSLGDNKLIATCVGVGFRNLNKIAL